MRNDYKAWLETQQYDSGTVNTQLYRVGRVEENYGSLDEHYTKGTLQSIIDALNYSTADERQNKPNTSKIQIQGNIRNSLQSYKNAVVRYRKFLTGWERADSDAPPSQITLSQQTLETAETSNETMPQRFSLERDMQAMLRRNISSLGTTLSIIDDGVERSVDSGFIDITCRDSSDNTIIVIELKADKAEGKAIGQIFGYMGDIALEEEGIKIKGILVAHDFDKRARAAARVVPSLTLMKYAVAFKFETVE